MWRVFFIGFVISSGDAAPKQMGLLLLYKPLDITNDCANSHNLRYDLSFGMGLSDTITVVLRTLNEIDYACLIEIVSLSENVFIIVVIRFPGSIAENCAANRDAFIVLKKKKCLRLCDLLDENDAQRPYYVFMVKGRFRFNFLSNSSINANMNAYLYQVTATSAREKPIQGCNGRNETNCSMNGADFCFTNGVFCDGIKNCGVYDWFDERKVTCGIPLERLEYAPVMACIAAIVCALVTAVHIIMRCLPSLANSFYIFNANEDNRLCIDPVFQTLEEAAFNIDTSKRNSLMPVKLSSSSESEPINIIINTTEDDPRTSRMELKTIPVRKTTMRLMTEKIHETLRLVTGRSKENIIHLPRTSDDR